jgi:GAF domain-containing protein
MAALQLGAMLDGNRIADELWEMVELAPDAMLHRAILRINEVGPPYDWVGVYLLNEDLLILHSYIGEHTECTRIPVGEGVCGIAVAEARDINVPDVEAFKGYMACSFNARSEIVTLIRDGERVLGLINIDSQTPSAFDEDDELALQTIAESLGNVLGQHLP